MARSMPRAHGPAIDALRIVLAAAGIAGLIAAFNYVVDPLQIFHRPWFYPARYTSDPRLGNAGLIESQRFDTAFMGTSFSYAIRQSEIDDALGGKSLKLAMTGGTSKEQFVVLSAALRKQPQRIVWQMDDYMFRGSGDVDAYLKSDLYRRDVAGLSGYLFDLGTGREALWIVLGLWKPTRRLGFRLNEIGYLKFDRDDPGELNTVPEWVNLSAAFNQSNAKAAFEQNLKNPGLAISSFSDKMAANFDRDALALIRANPGVKFIVYFPPSSILDPVAIRTISKATFEMIQRFHEYQLRRLSELPNVSAFDFRDVEAITHDLSLYRDTIHYSPDTNKKLLAFIASGQHQVDRAKPTAALERLRGQVDRYVPPSD
jgi:hypothetical protein